MPPTVEAGEGLFWFLSDQTGSFVGCNQELLAALAALMSLRQVAEDVPVACVVGFDDTENYAQLGRLQYEIQILSGYADASKEAMWCIEYTEPVDLSRTQLSSSLFRTPKLLYSSLGTKRWRASFARSFVTAKKMKGLVPFFHRISRAISGASMGNSRQPMGWSFG
jgi:hypothetical protein